MLQEKLEVLVLGEETRAVSEFRTCMVFPSLSWQSVVFSMKTQNKRRRRFRRRGEQGNEEGCAAEESEETAAETIGSTARKR
jgi:hypothetical protein